MRVYWVTPVPYLYFHVSFHLSQAHLPGNAEVFALGDPRRLLEESLLLPIPSGRRPLHPESPSYHTVALTFTHMALAVCQVCVCPAAALKAWISTHSESCNHQSPGRVCAVVNDHREVPQSSVGNRNWLYSAKNANIIKITERVKNYSR